MHMKSFYVLVCWMVSAATMSAYGAVENESEIKDKAGNIGVQPSESIQVSVSTPQEYTQTNIALLVLKDESGKSIQEIASCVKHDLSFTHQIIPSIQEIEGTIARSQVKEYATQGFPLIIIMKEESAVIHWWLYDTQTGFLLSENSYRKEGALVRGWAHGVTDQLWKAIMGKPGFFSTKIAYCKEEKTARRVKHICIADYDGSHEQTIVKTPTINVAPRWNQDHRNPLLFYSECTNNNMRLVVVTMDKKRTIASNFDGLNMLPAFSADGQIVVYCASRGDGSSQLYLYSKGELKRLTHNTGNNISPSLMADSNQLFFCSDFQTGYPQIYHYTIASGAIEKISENGYCAAPAYCQSTNQLVYSKMINGVMQLMIYDVQQKTHKQITFDSLSKQEASWSPCGNYILFGIGKGSMNRLALLDLTVGTYHYLTSDKISCSYPHWSPVYAKFPAVS